MRALNAAAVAPRAGHEVAIAIATDAGGAGGGAREEAAGRVGRRGGGEVRDVFRLRVLGADGGDACVGGFAGFGERVVA